MKKILSIMLTVCILAASLSCTAAAASITPMERYSQTKTDEISEYTYISDANMQKLLSIKKSNSALIDYIFDEFSCEKMKYSPQYENLVSPDFEIGEIIFKDSYCVVSEDGKCIEVPKDICYKMMEDEVVSVNKKNGVSTLSDISISDQTTSENGYMRISVSAICDKKGADGSYIFLAVFEWLKTPFFRSYDAISLIGNSFAWASESSNKYSLVQCFHSVQTDSNGNTTEEDWSINYTTPTDFCSGGFYYTFVLPQEIYSTTVKTEWSNFVFILTAQGRVEDYDDPTQALTICAKYAHAQRNLQIEPSFNWNPVDDSTGGILLSGPYIKKYYHCYTQWDYNDHYDLYE